ncbi:polysaccharide biosynthesis protein [Paenacidovorax monticola]|uniref:Polysaccharide biosynthesis protein n=1 Tax=Paenacidovorax monticola TaxID=1926868 RepID=A0A7H0HK85_9BURK|nr:nucleoside-diphosphate sugar epimerase/dehydratase [Paenacidovorax monticola]QNP60951.1 polysaccharide biosynthesis protein [Paenacidovorax monticola]
MPIFGYTPLHRLLEWPRAAKRLFVVALDAGMGLLAMWLAFTLRLESLHWPEGLQWQVYALGPLLAFPIFVNQGLYRAIFRYTGIRALITTGKAVTLYGTLLLVILLVAQWEGVPRSVGVLQPVIFLLLVGASRALGWLWLADSKGQEPRRLLIYGAGSAGAQTAAGLAGMHQYQLKGFLDDDPAKIGRSINGVHVYAPQALPEMVQRLGVTDVLLAVPSTTRQRRRQIIESLSELPVRIRTLPGLSDLASGRVTVADFQELGLEDLIGREPVAPQANLLGPDLVGQVVLVTGAGGSIGSELCRQIVREGPARLLLVDHSEYSLYAIHHELQALRGRGMHACELVPLLASVADPRRMTDICETHRPNSIYHAAAYKHVPMVEANAGEGVLNNVFGTLNMVRMALEHGARSFVLVSTDKAVRPTNVMGASKRVAELVLQAIASSSQPPFGPELAPSTVPWRCPTRLSMVRFGNVLGSSGSVIPLFRRQIAAGGPITVTHPQVTRYFMTIPEAAQLVLQAGAMAEGGDLFLLDMGEPVRIADLARRMVALSGLTVRDTQHPGGDIAIDFTGLRPGEKLYEELLIGDYPLPTAHSRILRAREEYLPWPKLHTLLQALHTAASNNDEAAIRHLLAQLVQGYRYEPTHTPC